MRPDGVVVGGESLSEGAVGTITTAAGDGSSPNQDPFTFAQLREQLRETDVGLPSEFALDFTELVDEGWIRVQRLVH